MIRDSNGKWLNSQIFRQEALNFVKYGYYTSAPWGSKEWIEYWEEQLNRCKNGYESEGESITGHHYFYLNFAQIAIKDKSTGDSRKTDKIKFFPDFWDGDYNYFWALEIADKGITKEKFDKLRLNFKVRDEFLDGGYYLLVGKGRRKGYSYKNAAICANMYNTHRRSLSVIGAFGNTFADSTMQMVTNYLNFLNENTGWKKNRDVLDKSDHKRASYHKYVNGTKIESGYMSEVMTLTFKDNADAARGKDIKLMLFEEAGKFPNLKDSFAATDDALRDGKYTTGQIVIFGTSGDMEKGTVDFADMFYNPESYNCLPFVNIWDEEADKTNCGFFHPSYLNKVGFYDEQGNSDIEAAIEYDNKEIEKKRKSTSGNTSVLKYKAENPNSPAEAFKIISTNDFPIFELNRQLNKIKINNLHVIKGQAATIFHDSEENKVKVELDLVNSIPIIWERSQFSTNKTGGLIIFESPTVNPPSGLYKIGYDPYRQDDGESLAVIIVYKGVRRGDYSSNQIVARYAGRPSIADDVNRIAELLCEFYNAELMFENEVTHVKAYFERRKKLHLLALQPNRVISNNVQNSKVARVYGCHMNDKLKDAGEKYIKKWLLEERDTDEFGNVLCNIDMIFDPLILEELIKYNRKGNFDTCLVENMLITTSEGFKVVQDVVIGDLVLTDDGTYKKVIETFIKNYNDDILTLKISGEHNNLICTKEHPILIASTSLKKHSDRVKALDNVNYKAANTLNDKYQFALVPKRKDLKKYDLSDDMLYLIGWCLSDGYIDINKNHISICFQHDQMEMAIKIANIIDEYATGETTIPKNYIKNNKVVQSNRIYKPSKCVFKIKHGSYIKVIKHSKKLSNLLHNLGCIPNNKFIASELYNSSNLMPLVIGFLEGDGSYNINKKMNRVKITVVGIYQKLILQIRQILIDNGIYCSLQSIKNGYQTSLTISTNYIDKLLSFYPSLKYKLCNQINRKRIELETEVGFWLPIKIIDTKFCNTTVYNFKVEDNHTYVANNIVNHNCMTLMQVMFQIEEEDLGKEYGNNEPDKTSKQLLELSNTLFKRN